MPTLEEVQASVQGDLLTTRGQLLNGMEQNPDQAAQAVNLEKSTGVPAQVISGDQEGFIQKYKSAMAERLVMQNADLRAYVHNHPMAAAVSNDDWGTLDYLSMLHGLKATTDFMSPQEMVPRALKGAAEGWTEGIGIEPTTSFSQIAKEMKLKSVEDIPAVAGAWLANLGIESATRVGSGFFGAVGGAVTGALGEQGFGRDIKGMVEYEMMRPGAMGPKMLDTKALGTWLAAGKMPPVGLVPELDAFRAKANEKLLESLEEATDFAKTNSTTLVRSPELFKAFVKQRLGEDTISISGDTVVALYGNKVPVPGDGLLGWVPNIENQFAAAAVDGSAVVVPKADWVTYIDPQVAQQLRDNIQVHPEGITRAEATVERAQVPPPSPDAVSQVRHASGLEPVFRPEPAATDLGRDPGRPESLGAARSDHPMIIGLDKIDPKAVGLPEGHWEKLQDLAQHQYEDDMSLATRKAERDAKRMETAEWKSNRADMMKEVEAEIRAMPHVAADLFVGAGELDGKKIQQRFTLREEDLTDAQKAALPAHYVSKNGLGIDDVATHFGFGSGDSLVESLAAHHALKDGRSPREMLDAMVKAETDRRMEQKYGDLPTNILLRAHDQALSDTTLNLVTQEYQGAAMSAKAEVLTEAHIKAEAKRNADGVLVKDVNSRKKLAEVSKHYSDAVKGLLGNDPALTVTALQRRAIGAHVARELLEREKYIAQTEALMAKLAKWKEPGKNEVKSVDPEYINWAHVIMQKVGQKIHRSPESLLEDIASRDDKTLEDFVDSKHKMLREMPVWPQLFDRDGIDANSGWRKDWKYLDGEEARAVGDSLKTLDFHGRDELKVQREGEVADRDTVIGEMVDGTRRFERKPVDDKGERTDLIGRLTKYPRQFMVNVLQMETFLNYRDKFDPWGVWTQYVMRGLVDGANQADAWAKEFTKHLAEANDGVDLSKEVDNPLFRVPREDGEGLGQLFRMTRENLRMVLLNAGNSAGARSNLVKMAKGYGLKPEEIMAWLHQHATKEDWNWAQKVWDNVFERMWKEGASMYRSISGGITPERVRIDPIQTKFGEYRGGYMPVDYHPKFKRGQRMDVDGLMQSNYHSALPQASWAKERTGASGPLNLDMSRLPMLITRELHDIAMRPSLIQASKLLLDSRVQDAVASKMGSEYTNMFRQYLTGVANRQNYLTTHPAYANSMLETLRKNLVTGLVGYNPGTVMKHAPTAFILTAREIGPEYMQRAYKALYNLNHETSQAAWNLTNTSHELQRRDRNWEETLYGEMLKTRPGGMSETWTNQLAKYSAKPVAWSDMFSARAAFLGSYMKAIDEGRSPGDAMFMGERAVRRAHGSTALTNRPQIMRDWNPWFTSVYTFFNDIVNRQMEMAWRAGEMLRDRKTEGTWEAAKAHVPAITATLFASVIAPAIIEELVSPSGGPNQKDENLGTKIVKDGFYTLSSGLPGVRDFVHGILSGTDPTPAGLAKTAAGGVQNVYRDLFTKKDPWSKAHAQRIIKDTAGPLAMITGKVTQSMGNVAAFGYGYAKGQEHPKDPWGWFTGLRYGTLAGHSASYSDWWEGKSQPRSR